MEVKKRLYLELSAVVRSIIRENKEDFDKPTNDLTSRLCCVLEAMFIHGLKEKFIVRKMEDVYPEPNFWPCISKFLHGNVRAQISNLNQIKNDVGRSKAWIRLALADGVMENYLSLIAKDQKLLKFYYHAFAFLRDVELVEVMCHYLRSLSKYRFKLALNSSLLNVWTPSPLRFAGYIDDKIIGYGSMTSSSDQSAMLPFGDEPDVIVGVSALEFDGLRDDRMSCSLSSDALSEDFSTTASTSHVIGESVEEILYEQIVGSFSKELAFPFIHQRHTNTTSVQNVLDHEKVDSKVTDESQSDEEVAPFQMRQLSTIAGSDSSHTNIQAQKLFAPSSIPSAEKEKESTVVERERSTVELSEASELFYSFAADGEVNAEEPSQDPTEASATTLNINLNIGNSLLNQSWSECFKTVSSASSTGLVSSSTVEHTLVRKETCATEDVTVSVGCKGVAAADFAVTSKYCPKTVSNVFRNFSIMDRPVNAEENERNERRNFLEIYLATPSESGLDNEENICHGCSKPIGFAFGAYRTCHYDGHYYCSSCHSNDRCLIPSALVRSWDLKPRTVCRRCRFFLNDYFDQPLIQLNKENLKLCLVINCLAEVQKLRQQLNCIALYMNSCRQFVGEDFRKRFYPKEYLYTDIHLYSVMDLVQASTGELQQHLSLILQSAVKHVFSCRLCFQKGFVCELCFSTEVIFPFQLDTILQCPKCFCVLHKSCVAGQHCPKCARREKYRERNDDHLFVSFDSTLPLDDL